MTELNKSIGSNECYKVVWSSDGKEFFCFFSRQFEQSGPQTRFNDCRVFTGQGAYKLGTRTFKQGLEVWYAYMERLPIWWDQVAPAPAANSSSGHAR